jgi:hypothetical protein
MSDYTNYAENKIQDAFWRGQPLGVPATWYVALATAVADAEAGTITEVAGGSYARVAVTASLANFAGTQAAGSTTASSGTSGQTSNNAAITFPAPSADWGSVTHFALFDASTGGNAWITKALPIPKTVNNGDPAPNFPAGALTHTLA